MSGTLCVTDWEKWQSYRKDRGQPPWIKIHRRIMRNQKWVLLSDAERGQLVAIWLLAADHDGVIMASPEFIQKICFMSTTPDIQKFIDLGLLYSHDAKVTSRRRQRVTPKAEKIREDKIREESTLIENENGFDKFWATYPKKVGKVAALKAWKRLKKPASLLPVMLSAIDIQSKSLQWTRDSGQYIPHPSTWLNEGRWEDEPLDEDKFIKTSRDRKQDQNIQAAKIFLER